MASMEYIFELTEGRRAVIYDEGSQIIIAFMAYGRIINQAVLEREYHSELNAITWGNNIYLAYVTVSNAITWLQVGGTGRVIIYANDSSVCHVMDLKLGEVDHKLLLFYCVQHFCVQLRRYKRKRGSYYMCRRFFQFHSIPRVYRFISGVCRRALFSSQARQ